MPQLRRPPAGRARARPGAGRRGRPGVPGGVGDGAEGAVCGGILKSATISFGQSLVAEDLVRAEEAAAECDLLLAVGSTLAVFPAAGLVPVAVRHGAVVRHRERRAHRDGPPGRRGAAGVHRRLPAGAGGGAGADYVSAVDPPPPRLGLAAGLEGEPPDAGDGAQRHGSGGHRLDDFAAPLLAMAAPYPAKAGMQPGPTTSLGVAGPSGPLPGGGRRRAGPAAGGWGGAVERPVKPDKRIGRIRPAPAATFPPCRPGPPGPGRRRAAGPWPPRGATAPPGRSGPAAARPPRSPRRRPGR